MSTSESKKSSSSKDSKKEHQNTDEIPVEEVHTANNWEEADLGDNQRKQKFLRLMGAKKRKDESGTDRQNSRGSNHEDDTVPEKKHCRSKVETETINRDLEKQFTEGLQAKLAHTHHGGLGFHDEKSSASGSGDWQHQSTKTKFVPAKTEEGAAMDHVKVDDAEKSDDSEKDNGSKKGDDTKSNEKKEKKRKSHS